MIRGSFVRRLQAVRLSRLQLAALTACSALATVLVVVNATGTTSLQAAVIAALNRRLVIHRTATPAAIDRRSASAATNAPSNHPATAVSSQATSAPPVSPAAVASASIATTTTTTTTTSAPAAKTYKVKHVFVIALSTTDYQAAFGRTSVAAYLNRTLVPAGTLLTGYQSLGSSALPDYLAMVSGQPPNPDTTGECATYAEFPTTAGPDNNGVVRGAGCVYPNTVTTVADQQTSAGKTWRAYLDDMGPTACAHPNSNATDNQPLPGAGSQYATRHNPFIYFHSLLDLGGCSASDVALDQLRADLRAKAKTPTYSFIAPSLCADASAQTCPNGAPGGLAAEDAFLKQWVPLILSSPAYKQDGALIIAFAPPLTPPRTGNDASVRTGALVISRFARAAGKLPGSYNPYSLLRSIEDLFAYKPLARAKTAKSFAALALPAA